MLKNREIIAINLAAGLVAGALVGVAEVIYRELYTRVQGKALAEETATVIESANDGTGE